MKILERKIQIYEIVRMAKEPHRKDGNHHERIGNNEDRFGYMDFDTDDYSDDMDEDRIIEVQDDDDSNGEGTWITTEQGKHILINPKDGTIMAGNIGVAKQGDKLHPKGGGQFKANFSQQTEQANAESRQREEKKEETKEEPKEQPKAEQTKAEQTKSEQTKAEQPKETPQTEQTSEPSQWNTEHSQNGNWYIDPSEDEEQEQNHSQEQNQSEQTQPEQSESTQNGNWYIDPSEDEEEQSEQQAKQEQQQNPDDGGQEEPTDQEWQMIQRALHPQRYEQPSEQPTEPSEQPTQQSEQPQQSPEQQEQSSEEQENPENETSEEQSEQPSEQQSQEEQTEQQEPTQQQTEQSENKDEPTDQGQQQAQQQSNPQNEGKSKKKGHIVQQKPATPQSTDTLPQQRRKVVQKYQERLLDESGKPGGRPDLVLDEMAHNSMCVKMTSLINGQQIFFIPQNPYDQQATPRWIPCKKGPSGQVVPLNDNVYSSETLMQFALKAKHAPIPLDLGGQFKQYSEQYEEQVRKDKEKADKQKQKEEAKRQKEQAKKQKQEQRKRKQEQRKKQQQERQKEKQRKQQQRKRKQEQRRKAQQQKEQQKRKAEQEKRKAQQQKQKAEQQKQKEKEWNDLKNKYGLSDEDRDIIEKLNPQQRDRVAQAMAALKGKPLTPKEQKEIAKERIRQAKEELRAAKAAKKGVHNSTKGSYAEFKRAVNGSTADIAGQKFVRQNGVWKNVQSGKVVSERDLANLVTAIRRNQRHAKYDLNDVASMRMDRAKNTQQARHALNIAQRGAMMIVGGVTYRKDKSGKWIGNNNSTLTEGQLARYSIRAKKAGISSGFYQKKPFTTGQGFKESMQQLNGG